MKCATTAVAVLLLFIAPAWAADCNLQLLNMVPISVTDNVMTVPVVLNGGERRFAFDTAALASQITLDAARGLKLPVEADMGPRRIAGSGAAALAASTIGSTSGSATANINAGAGIAGGSVNADNPVEIYNAAGVPFERTGLVQDLKFGAMQSANIPLQITDFPPRGTDGLLNGSLFARYDLDLNFHGNRFNMFAATHCPGQVLYWRAPGMAALPMLTRNNRIAVHVSVDGKDLTAVIDTGAAHSEMKMADATRLFDIGPDSAGVTLKQPSTANDRDRYSYDFKTLSFGTVAIGNPHLLLTRDILVRGANPKATTGSLLRAKIEGEPAMVIGMDLLKLLHIYIASGERMLYVTQGPELDVADPKALPVVAVTPFRP